LLDRTIILSRPTLLFLEKGGCSLTAGVETCIDSGVAESAKNRFLRRKKM